VEEERLESIRALVRSTYQDPRVVARYAEVGLWPSEETLILEYVADDARVLDVGCGAGRTSVPLREMGFSVTAVDLSPTMVELAREVGQACQVDIDFRVMDVMDLTLPSDSFEFVLFSYNGFELLPGRAGKERALREVFRVLKPGGHFIFSSHSPFALNQFALLRLRTFTKFLLGRALNVPMKEREFGERFSEEDDEEVKYIQILPPSTLLQMLRKTGFEVCYHNTRRRIERQWPWRWWGVFEDGERMYVAQKPR
jgi:ubiquinone/menaquinone biosynthesis C-methylase UbiE